MSAALLVIQGRNQGNRVVLDERPLELGRGGAAGFRVLDTEVSRLHARAVPQSDGSVVLSDLGSSNGTFVNGKPIDSVVLENGDHVQLGRTVLLFQAETNDAEASWRRAAEEVDLAAADVGEESIVAQLDAEASQAVLGHVQPGGATTAMLQTSLSVLYEVSELVVRPSVGVDELLQSILALTLEAVGAERGVMLVADPQTDEIVPRVFGGRTATERRPERMPISRTIVDYVLTHGRGVLTSDAAGDSRFAGHESILRVGIREAMCVPMQGRFELLGVIYVDTTATAGQLMARDAGRTGSSLDAPRFSGEMLALLAAIGRQSALAVENHRYQDALVKAERLAAVGQTVAMLSHHLKNILQGMRGGGYLVEKGLEQEKGEMARRGWGILDRNQERLYNLVMDMLAFSKERVPSFEECAINEIVLDVADLMRAAADEQDVRLVAELSSDLLLTQADREGLHRAVLNLVVNAIEAMDDRDDGTIWLRTGREGESITIDVADNGPGISPEQRAKLFALFESSKGSRGTGLGLAVSRKILREHGGEIEVSSELGEGTTFRLRVPLRESSGAEESMKKTGEFDVSQFTE